MASPQYNKNAEKWTFEEAEKLYINVVKLIESRHIQFLSDIHVVLKSGKGSYMYVLKKFGLSKKITDLIRGYKPNRKCLSKRNEEQKTKDRVNSKEIYHNKKKHDINYRLRTSVSSLVSYHINKRNAIRKKSFSRLDMLNFSINELKLHLNEKFEKGMTFDNYGTWHIDHIIPCSWFDLSDETQFKQCWSLSNLKPMWASENISKQNRYSENTQLNLFF